MYTVLPGIGKKISLDFFVDGADCHHVAQLIDGSGDRQPLAYGYAGEGAEQAED